MAVQISVLITPVTEGRPVTQNRTLPPQKVAVPGMVTSRGPELALAREWAPVPGPERSLVRARRESSQPESASSPQAVRVWRVPPPRELERGRPQPGYPGDEPPGPAPPLVRLGPQRWGQLQARMGLYLGGRRPPIRSRWIPRRQPLHRAVSPRSLCAFWSSESIQIAISGDLVKHN